jgi:hypothetical protein
LLPLPAWAHEGVGITCFIGAALGIYLSVRSLQEKTT